MLRNYFLPLLFRFRSQKLVLTFMITELDARMTDMKSELQSFQDEEYDESHRRKAVEALKRMENWNLFSDPNEVCSLIGSGLFIS